MSQSAGAFSAFALMLALPWPTWRRLIIWFVIGIVVYFLYGVRRSNLAQPPTIETKHTGAG